MSVGPALTLLGWIPFLHPVTLPAGARLWMLLPLVFCIAVVYRATRTRRARSMPKATIITFINIVLGMVAIAAAFYLVHHAVLRFS